MRTYHHFDVLSASQAENGFFQYKYQFFPTPYVTDLHTICMRTFFPQCDCFRADSALVQSQQRRERRDDSTFAALIFTFDEQEK